MNVVDTQQNHLKQTKRNKLCTLSPCPFHRISA
jgi:hypothetical protein